MKGGKCFLLRDLLAIDCVRGTPLADAMLVGDFSATVTEFVQRRGIVTRR